MVKFKLVFKSGALAGSDKTFDDQEVVIGRDPILPISMDDPKVSRDHLRIYPEKDKLFLEDLGSTNGTFVNGKRLGKSTELKNGDLISLGDNNVFEVDILEAEPEHREEKVIESTEAVAAAQPQQPEAKVKEPEQPKEKLEKPERKAKAKRVSKTGALGQTPTANFFASLPTWAVVLLIAVGFFILFCLIPFVIIEATDQWCNLFSGFFNAISPGVCP